MLFSLILYLIATEGAGIHDKLYLILLLVTILYQIYKILPYTRLTKTQVLNAEEDLWFRFRFLTFASLDVSERSRLRVSDRR